jgi:hypothetical protein
VFLAAPRQQEGLPWRLCLFQSSRRRTLTRSWGWGISVRNAHLDIEKPWESSLYTLFPFPCPIYWQVSSLWTMWGGGAAPPPTARPRYELWDSFPVLTSLDLCLQLQ